MDKCITTEEQDNNGTPCVTQMMYNYEFIDDFDDKPQLDILGNFLLKTVKRYKSESYEKDIPMVTVNHQLENGDRNSLLSNQTAITPTVKQHFDILLAKNWGPKSYEKDNHTMTLMVTFFL